MNEQGLVPEQLEEEEKLDTPQIAMLGKKEIDEMMKSEAGRKTLISTLRAILKHRNVDVASLDSELKVIFEKLEAEAGKPASRRRKPRARVLKDSMKGPRAGRKEGQVKADVNLEEKKPRGRRKKADDEKPKRSKNGGGKNVDPKPGEKKPRGRPKKQPADGADPEWTMVKRTRAPRKKPGDGGNEKLGSDGGENLKPRTTRGRGRKKTDTDTAAGTPQQQQPPPRKKTRSSASSEESSNLPVSCVTEQNVEHLEMQTGFPSQQMPGYTYQRYSQNASEAQTLASISSQMQNSNVCDPEMLAKFSSQQQYPQNACDPDTIAKFSSQQQHPPEETLASLSTQQQNAFDQEILRQFSLMPEYFTQNACVQKMMARFSSQLQHPQNVLDQETLARDSSQQMAGYNHQQNPMAISVENSPPGSAASFQKPEVTVNSMASPGKTTPASPGKGPRSSRKRKQEAQLDELLERFRRLGLDEAMLVPFTGAGSVALGKKSSKTRVTIEKKKMKTIAPYLGAGPVVITSDGKKQARAKVSLDDETERVYHLLMSNDDEDPDTASQWQAERDLWKKHVDDFIKCMRNVQGNRRFIPWHGSVMDSVIGVFLTQNVADHLSSSAFMNLAARFPPQVPESEQEKCDELGDPIDELGDPISVGDEDSDTRSKVRRALFTEEESTSEPRVRQVEKPLDGEAYAREEEIFLKDVKVVMPEEALGEGAEEVAPMIDDLEFMEHVLEIYRWAMEMESKQVSARKRGRARAKYEHKKSYTKTSYDWDKIKDKVRMEQGALPPEDSVDWYAVHDADIGEIANAIRERGMSNLLAGRIKAVLARIHDEHGSINLEWLRHLPPTDAKEFLLTVRGLGIKSVECIRLLTLGQVAFPVDVNVGRILVRLGWVPIQPLPGNLEFHLLEGYPIQEAIQKYLWPRLLKMSHETLYELHYQLITFGKVFCTKLKPNCQACPLRDGCKHYESARRSANLLPAPDSVSNDGSNLKLPAPAATSKGAPCSEPIIEEPLDEAEANNGGCCGKSNTSCSACPMSSACASSSSSGEIPDMEDFPAFVGRVKRKRPAMLSDDTPLVFSAANEGASSSASNGGASSSASNGGASSSSSAEVEIPSDFLDLTGQVDLSEVVSMDDDEAKQDGFASASHELMVLPNNMRQQPKLKDIYRLRTIHFVYELPQDHPILRYKGLKVPPLEENDPNPYLFMLYQPTGKEEVKLEKLDDSLVYGSLLIPCRTAMRARFPLNGTYFQVNEMFADHDTIYRPIVAERKHLWQLKRRFVNFGTSVSTIFRGLTTQLIQAFFWRGYVCVRAFERATRRPKPLAPWLHAPEVNKKRAQEKQREERERQRQELQQQREELRKSESPRKKQRRR